MDDTTEHGRPYQAQVGWADAFAAAAFVAATSAAKDVLQRTLQVKKPEPPDMRPRVEFDKFLLEYMKEQYTQARQHDTLRTSATTFLTGAAGVILGFQFKDGSMHPNPLIGLLLVLVGVANYHINQSHYFGNRYHNIVIARTREALEKLFKCLGDSSITKVRERAIEDMLSSRGGKGGKYGGMYRLKSKSDSVGDRVHKNIQYVPKGVMFVGAVVALWGVVDWVY